MVGHVGIVVAEVVIEYTSVLAYQCDTQLLVVEAVHESRRRAVDRLLLTMNRLMHLCIETLQPCF